MVDYRVAVTGEKPPYSFSLIDKKRAESEKIPHGVVFCLTVNPYGELLRVRRARSNPLYPDHNSVPAGHMDVVDDRCETPEETANRELWEETRLVSRKVAPFLGDEQIVDRDKGHVGFAYLMFVGACPLMTFNEEIEPMESRFEPLDEIEKKLETEKWTPPSRHIVEKLVASHPDGLKELYEKLAPFDASEI